MVEEREREAEAPFNMALASLQRIDSVLQQISILDSQYPLDSAEKQKASINLLKRFFVISSPLLFKSKERKKDEKGKEKKDEKEKEKKDDEKTHLETLREEILTFQIETKNVVRSGTQIMIYAFSITKEKRINEILIELQLMLSPYMMPGKREVEGLI